ncbi:MAG TPA: TetR/AcrR family transcriptional regulator [Bacillota bacterium]|nr:TetR/AcrR family transcriptional regulator [Bacillota bacterium]
MPNNVLDRRVQKTRQSLRDALIELIAEKGFEAVTIQEILDRANVGRSTFYTHFENKHELLHSCFEDFHHLFEKHNTYLTDDKKHIRDFNETDLTLDLFRFTARNQRLFKALLGKEGAMFNHPIHEYILTFIEEVLKKLTLNKKLAPLQMEISAHYMASAFIGTLKWWVEKDMPCSAEEIDHYFKQFVMNGIGEVLH